MSDDCVPSLLAELRKSDEFASVSDKDLEAIAQKIDDIKYLAQKDGVDFKAKALKELEGIEREFVNKELRIKTQALREKNLRNHILAEEGKAGPRLTSVIVGSTSSDFKGGKSVAMDTATRTDTFRRGFANEVEGFADPKTEARIMRREIDRDAMAEILRLRDPKSTVPDTGNELAKNLAKAVVRTQDAQRAMLEASYGHPIGKVEDYIAPRTHDPYRIERAGYLQWEKDILAVLDKDETFGARAGDMNFIKKELQADYNQITKSAGVTDSTKGRSYKFNKAIPDAEWKYNEKYGQHGLYESVMETSADVARRTALMDTFGPNPDKGFEAMKKIVEDIERAKYKEYMLNNNSETLKNAFKRTTEKSKILKFFKDSTQAQAGYDHVNGKLFVGGDMYATASTIRSVINVALLKNTGLRAFFQNPVPAGAYAAMVTGKNPYMMMAKSFVASWGNRAENKMLAKKAGMMVEDISNEMTYDLQQGASRPGYVAHKIIMAAKWAEANGPEWFERSAVRAQNIARDKGALGVVNHGAFEANGLSGVNRINATGMNRLVMSELADMSNKSFDELPAATRLALGRHGLTADHWSVMQWGVDEAPSGLMYMSPSKIASLPDDIIRNDTKLTRPRDIQKFRQEIADGYGGFLREGNVHYATTTPDASIQALMTAGIATDNPWAGPISMMLQFKAFSVQQMKFLSQIAKAEMAAKSLEGGSKLAQTGEAAKAIGAFVSSATALWWMSKQMQNLVGGHSVDNNLVGTPGIPDFLASKIQNPANPHVLFNALLKSGSLGIVGDTLDAGTSGGSGSNMIAYGLGPSLTMMGKTVDIGYQNLIQGKNTDQQTAALVRNFLPGQFFLTQRLVEPLITYPILNTISPAYVLKEEQRMMLRDAGIKNER